MHFIGRVWSCVHGRTHSPCACACEPNLSWPNNRYRNDLPQSPRPGTVYYSLHVQQNTDNSQVRFHWHSSAQHITSHSKILVLLHFTTFLDKVVVLSIAHRTCLTPRGTNDGVFRFTNEIFYSKDNNKYLMACFLDVRKAFDSMHHLELVACIRLLEIPLIYTDWLLAYLANRSQRVVCNGTNQFNLVSLKGLYWDSYFLFAL